MNEQPEKNQKPREIEREPEVPELSHEVIHSLTELCFRQDDELQPIDLLFIFGTSDEDIFIQEIQDILSQKLTDKVMITGGRTEAALLKTLPPESEVIKKLINVENFPEVTFYTEGLSTNTKENVLEALKVFDLTKLSKIMFVFKSHAAGRGYLVLKTFLPDVEILQRTVPGVYADKNGSTIKIGREDWFTTEVGRSRVWGEFLRIKKYGLKGYFNVDDVRDTIDKISINTK